jgi:hypothetical protein
VQLGDSKPEAPKECLPLTGGRRAVVPWRDSDDWPSWPTSARHILFSYRSTLAALPHHPSLPPRGPRPDEPGRCKSIRSGRAGAAGCASGILRERPRFSIPRDLSQTHSCIFT